MDTGNDLNVYIDMAKHGATGNGDGVVSCCSKASSDLQDPSVFSWNLSGTDLNEWAGKFPCTSKQLRLVEALTDITNRFVQDLCCQTVVSVLAFVKPPCCKIR